MPGHVDMHFSQNKQFLVLKFQSFYLSRKVATLMKNALKNSRLCLIKNTGPQNASSRHVPHLLMI